MAVITGSGVINPTIRKPKKNIVFPSAQTPLSPSMHVLKVACPCGDVMWIYYSHKTPMFAICGECGIVYADTRVYSNTTTKIQLIIAGRYPGYADMFSRGENLLSPTYTLPEIYQ